ncbi:HU family DNA-binding protein [Maritimibacter dapengensis]|uniref:HU family DNA-binding protein n=1 Tax=Maritimibacter dapengensis TaxID=2836868 RepID=A0ABS6T2U3_9RHOB|nr:HU family DNA-binding protein [Maritimibacter dapengensis]MBV7379552.1 HU family DNA-binding protein [Maritimibacter dapengensis]
MATTKSSSKSTTKKTTRKTAARSTSKSIKPKTSEPEFEPQDDEVSASEVSALVALDVEPEQAAAPVQGVTRAVTDGSASAVDKLVKKDLVDRVIARSGVKPRHARQVTEALLTELGAMLEEAETLQLQPLGNLKVQRRKDLDDGEVIITKLRRKKPETEIKDPLVPAAE